MQRLRVADTTSPNAHKRTIDFPLASNQCVIPCLCGYSSFVELVLLCSARVKKREAYGREMNEQARAQQGAATYASAAAQMSVESYPDLESRIVKE
jgi:hypothetical protein